MCPSKPILQTLPMKFKDCQTWGFWLLRSKLPAGNSKLLVFSGSHLSWVEPLLGLRKKKAKWSCENQLLSKLYRHFLVTHDMGITFKLFPFLIPAGNRKRMGYSLNKNKGPKDKSNCPRVQKRFTLSVGRFRFSESSPSLCHSRNSLGWGSEGLY